MTNIKMNNLRVSVSFWVFWRVGETRPVPLRERSGSHNRIHNTVKDSVMIPSRSNLHPAALETDQHNHDHSHDIDLIDTIPPTLSPRYPAPPHLNNDVIHHPSDSTSAEGTISISSKPTVSLRFSPSPAHASTSMFFSPLPLLTFTCIILVFAYITSYLRKRWFTGRRASGSQSLELLPTSNVDAVQISVPGTLPIPGLGPSPIARTVGVAWNPGRRGGRAGLAWGLGSGVRTARSKSLGGGLCLRGRNSLPAKYLAHPFSRPRSTPVLPDLNTTSGSTPTTEDELLIDLSTPEEDGNRKECKDAGPSPGTVHDSILSGSHVWAFDITTGSDDIVNDSASPPPLSSPDPSHHLSSDTSVETSPATTPSPLWAEFNGRCKSENGVEPIYVLPRPLQVRDQTFSHPIEEPPPPKSEFIVELVPPPTFVVVKAEPGSPAGTPQLSHLGALPASGIYERDVPQGENLPEANVARDIQVVPELSTVTPNEVRGDLEDSQLEFPFHQAPRIPILSDEKNEAHHLDDLGSSDNSDFEAVSPLLTPEGQESRLDDEVVELKSQPKIDGEKLVHIAADEENLEVNTPPLALQIIPAIHHEEKRCEKSNGNDEDHDEPQHDALHDDINDVFDNTAPSTIHSPTSPERVHPDPDLLPLPVSAPSPIRAQTPVQTPTPPASPSSSPLSHCLPLPHSTNTNNGPRPAWSLRASDAPILGLTAKSKSLHVFPGSFPNPHISDESNEKDEDASSLTIPTKASASPLGTDVVTTSAQAPVCPPQSDSESSSHTRSPSSPSILSTSTQLTARSPKTTRRLTRSPLDIALAMQLRPGLGPGADPAWMVRFLMSMFGWFALLIGGNGNYDQYYLR